MKTFACVMAGAIGGAIVCSYSMLKVALQNERIRKGIIDAIVDKIETTLYSEEQTKSYQKRNYYNYYR